MKKFLIITLLILGMPVFAAPLYDVSNEAKLEYNTGVDLYKAGQYEKSMLAFQRAISLDPNYIDAYYNLGLIQEFLKKDEDALNTFKQVMVRNPDDYDSVYKAASISYKLGQIDNAKKYLTLIPAESNAYEKAQILAKSMGTDIQTIKIEAQKAAAMEALQEANRNNNIYNELPSPTGIASDKEGNLYVACFSNNMIYKITPDGRRIIFVKDSKINGPIAMDVDTQDNLYVSNYNGNNVIKITPTGNISTVISNVQKPYGVSISNGLLYVSSQGTNSVLKYKL